MWSLGLSRLGSWTEKIPLNEEEDRMIESELDQALHDDLEVLVRSKRQSRATFLNILGSTVIVVCLLFMLDVYTKLRISAACPSPGKRLGAQDSPIHAAAADPAGSISESVTIFGAHDDFMRPYSGPGDIWDTLLPPGRGFVFLRNGSKYGLEPGQETQWGEIYSVSLFHQVHCLALLRMKYWNLMNAALDRDDEAARAVAEQQLDSDHIGHCFDYLRQGIMCAGDMSMEWPRDEADGGARIHVDGWGIPHVCKDWDKIWDFMLSNGYNASEHTEIAV